MVNYSLDDMKKLRAETEREIITLDTQLHVLQSRRQEKMSLLESWDRIISWAEGQIKEYEIPDDMDFTQATNTLERVIAIAERTENLIRPLQVAEALIDAGQSTASRRSLANAIYKTLGDNSHLFKQLDAGVYQYTPSDEDLPW